MHLAQARPDRRSLLLGAAAAVALAPAASARPRRQVQWTRARALLQAYVADAKVAGACAALRFGAAEPDYFEVGALALGGAAAKPDTIWRVFSMSKPITGVAALTLVEAGKLRLNQPVADFIPEFAEMGVLEDGKVRPARTRMLVSHLLTHTSGLGYQINAGTSLAALYQEAGLYPGDPTPREGTPRSLDEFGARLAKLPLGYDPGTRYEYSAALDLMGLVIQRASGKPFDTYLQERLFAPMGMDDTGFVVPQTKAARLSANYQVRRDGLRALEPEGQSPYFATPAYPSGGGGIVSTAADYDRFCAMLLNGGVVNGRRILKSGTAHLAHTNLLPRGVDGEGGIAFGAGMGIVTRRSFEPGTEPPGAFGWAGAAGTLMWIDPVNRMSAVMMTQYMPSRAYPIWKEFRQAVYADLAA